MTTKDDEPLTDTKKNDKEVESWILLEYLPTGRTKYNITVSQYLNTYLFTETLCKPYIRYFILSFFYSSFIQGIQSFVVLYKSLAHCFTEIFHKTLCMRCRGTCSTIHFLVIRRVTDNFYEKYLQQIENRFLHHVIQRVVCCFCQKCLRLPLTSSCLTTNFLPHGCLGT